MVTKDGAEIRRQRIQKLIEMIRSNPDLTENKLIALFSLQNGPKKERVMDYIENLIEADIVEREDNRLIYLPDKK